MIDTNCILSNPLLYNGETPTETNQAFQYNTITCTATPSATIFTSISDTITVISVICSLLVFVAFYFIGISIYKR